MKAFEKHNNRTVIVQPPSLRKNTAAAGPAGLRRGLPLRFFIALANIDVTDNVAQDIAEGDYAQQSAFLAALLLLLLRRC
jgi:hypothetical protein